MLLWIYCFRLFFIRTFVCLSISWLTAWNFRIFQGLFTVQLSMYSQRFALSLEAASQLLSGLFNLTRCCYPSATAYLLYYTINRLSTTFLFSFASFLRKPLLPVLLVLRDNSFMISCIEAHVNNFFRKKIEQLIFSNKAEKEGFEPSRRLTRPIPLAGAPLRPLEYFSKVLIWQYDIVLRRDA